MISSAADAAGRTCAIVLAGGRSLRMGADKRALRPWGEAGPTLLEHAVGLLHEICDERLVVLSDRQAWAHLDARLVPDEQPGAGPLAGLATGLAAMTAGRALTIACDMPLARPALLRALAAWEFDADALVPRDDAGRDQPLLAVYRRSCLPAARACLAEGRRSMASLLARVRVHALSPDEWRPHDPDGRSFWNANRPEDLADLLTHGAP